MSTAPQKTIQEIQFGIFSPEEVKKMSVVEVLYPEMLVRSTPCHEELTLIPNSGRGNAKTT
jgi:DNA-directed RNA polymerase beta' subunit